MDPTDDTKRYYTVRSINRATSEQSVLIVMIHAVSASVTNIDVRKVNQLNYGNSPDYSFLMMDKNMNEYQAGFFTNGLYILGTYGALYCGLDIGTNP